MVRTLHAIVTVAFGVFKLFPKITDLPFETKETALYSVHPLNEGPLNFSHFRIFILRRT